jgi:hypothetical protein
MAKPLRSQLNQIRAWVRQGRTDAWIAHQLDVPASELREFRRRHELAAEEEEAGDFELRDEIEAEIEAATREADTAEGEERGEPEEEPETEDGKPEGEKVEDEEPEGEDGKPEGGRRRRRRRGRRGAARPAASMQATFDHGTEDGFGLWLDPAVEDDPAYAEHWAGHRKVEVTIEPDRIVIKRV